MKFQRTYFIVGLILGLVLVGRGALLAQINPAAHCNFDQVSDNRVSDQISSRENPIAGNFRLLPGVREQALVLDGYTRCIERRAHLVPFGRAWLLNPELVFNESAWQSRYDLTQRCYVLSRNEKSGNWGKPSVTDTSGGPIALTLWFGLN